MKRLGSTPPFQGPNGEIVPGSIAEIRYLHLGGLEQWVMIRGENTENPLLITLHGGPGFPETRLFRTFNAPLEKAFTVVYWEQRGTGKSFDPKIPKSSMTVEQFIADLDELVEVLRGRFGKDKVAIYGHSWGSALGVLYASRFPDKVAAYVGAGQVGDWPASEAICYEFSGTPRQPQSYSAAPWHRSSATHWTRADGTGQMADTLCRNGARHVHVESLTHPSRWTRIVDFGSAQHSSGNAVFHLHDVE